LFHFRDERFTKEEKYEWLKDYSHFRHLIQPHLTSNSSVLELGCGNSQMCEGLYMDGTTNITCIDLSHVAVHNMQNRLLSQKFKGSLSLSCLLFYNLFKRIKVNKLLIIEIHSISPRMEWSENQVIEQVVNELL
jgi:hypothetical protein